MKITAALATVVVLLSSSSSASASIISVDPASYAAGTDISSAFYGVTLSNIYNEANPDLIGPDGFVIARPLLKRSAIYATECSPCFSQSDGRMVFGHDWDIFGDSDIYDDTTFWYSNWIAETLAWPNISSGFPVRLVNTNYNALLAEFAEPTSYVEIIAGGAPMGNYTRVDLWAEDGSHIAFCSNETGSDPRCAGVPTGDPETQYPWSFSFKASDEKIAFLTAGGWQGTQYVHSIRYEVPEPGTLILFACGLIAMWHRRRNGITRNAVHARS